MSWLARSIANTLKLDDDEDDRNDVVAGPNQDHSIDNTNIGDQETDDSSSSSSPTSPSRGVREDISELTKTLTRQFWGVASFLAPPPESDPYKPLSESNSEPIQDPDEEEVDPIAGLRGDFAEISGRFKSGISKLSSNIAVSEITKMASNLLQLGPEDGEEEDEKGFDLAKGGVGVTEDVVAFVRDIVMHTETWLDFPLPDNEDDEVDFNLSDAQQEHALAVERIVPRLAALRIEFCPAYMSEARFWEIYFVLLHPRLDEQDAKLLSTPQVVKARELLMQELRKGTKSIEEDWSEKGTFESNDSNDHEEILSVPSTALSTDVIQEMSSVESAASVVESAASVAVSVPAPERQPVLNNEIQSVDKPVVEGDRSTHSDVEKLESASARKLEESDDDGDDWLKEESTDIVGVNKTTIPIENEEDVSFSDLEEDDEDVPASVKKEHYSSDKDSQDWVQLRKSSTNSVNQTGSGNGNVHNPDSKETNDWLDLDDIEVA